MGYPMANALGRIYTSEAFAYAPETPAAPYLQLVPPPAELAPAVELTPTIELAPVVVEGTAVATEGTVVAEGAAVAVEGLALVSNPVGWAILAGLAVVAIGAGVYCWTHQSQTEPKAEPKAQTKTQTNVQVRTDEKKSKRCPVCGQGVDPLPDAPPPYLTPPRAPKDWETIPPLNLYKRTSMVVNGARVWQMPSGGFIHVDTGHRGQAAELEVYDSRGRHLGTICPRCGAPRKPSKPGRRLPRN